ncbi:hypothetical protein [Bacillus sp. 1P06AnD]
MDKRLLVAFFYGNMRAEPFLKAFGHLERLSILNMIRSRVMESKQSVEL